MAVFAISSRLIDPKEKEKSLLLKNTYNYLYSIHVTLNEKIKVIPEANSSSLQTSMFPESGANPANPR